MDESKLSTVAAKLPAEVAERFEALAERRRLTSSRLLRTLVERELAGGPDDEVGEVEAAVKAELGERGADLKSARAAAAVNAARRLDRDPTSGSANAGVLRHLLEDLSPVGARMDGFSPLNMTRLMVLLKRLPEAFHIVPMWAVAEGFDGHRDGFNTFDVWREHPEFLRVADD